MNFTTEKQNLQKYIYPGLLAAALLLSFYPVFQKLAIRWDSGDNSYCYLVIPLFLYLCWEQKASFQFGRYSWNPWGVVPAVLSAVLMIVGEMGSVETLLYIGIWGCVAGALFTMYGLRVRRLLFPLLILAFIVPMPPFINRMLTFNLKLAASSLAVILLQLLGVSVLQEGNIIDIGVQQLQVVDACSGLRYFVPLVLMALLFGYFFHKRWWHRAVLLVAAPPLSVVVNGIRIFATAMLILNGHPELAEDFFHDFSGWLVFMIAGALLFGISQILKRLDRSAPAAPAEDSPKLLDALPVRGWRPRALTAVLCLLFIGAGWTLRALPASLIIPPRNTFETFPMQIGEWQGTRSYLSKEILDNLWADDYVTATYISASQNSRIYLLIPYYEYQGTRHTAHAPQSCLLGGGWDLLHTRDVDLSAEQGKDYRVRTILMQKGEHRMLGSYFFLQRGRVILSPWLNKLYLVWDAMTQRRTDGALVRVELLLAPGQDLEDGYRLLQEFIADLGGLLPRYVPA